MLKLMSLTAAVALTILPTQASAQAILGPDAPACRAGANDPAILVNVTGFKNRIGRLRVQLYGPKASDFLAKGKKLRRVDIPVTSSGPMAVCIVAPAPGTYAIAVRHDADDNGKSSLNDGGGFSRNPSLSLFSRPKHSEVAIRVNNGVQPITVILNYRQGLSVGPVGGR